MKQFGLAVLFVLIACAGPEPKDPQSPADPVITAPAETAAPADSTITEAGADAPAVIVEDREKPKEKRPEISIDSVVMANPIKVRGHARTFENTVSLRVRDQRGSVIAETFTTSVGEMGRHNPFEATLWLVQDPGARVTVEAFEYSAKDGSVQSLVRQVRDNPIPTLAVRLTFPVGDCTNLRPFTRRVPKSVAMARLLVEALVAGPIAAERAAGATAPFPKGSAVRSAILRQGEITVDFNERLQNVGGSCAAMAIRGSVEATLKQLPTVQRVIISAAGSRELALQP